MNILYRFILGLFISFILSTQNHSFANTKSEWESQFIGVLNFSLADDPSYLNEQNKVKEQAKLVASIKNKIERSEDELARFIESKLEKERLKERNEDKIHALNSQINQINQNIPSMKQEFSELTRLIPLDENQLVQINNQITTTKAEANTLSNQANLTKNEIRNKEALIRELESRVPPATSAEITPIRTELMRLSTRLNTEETRLNKLEERVDELKNKATNLTQKIASDKERKIFLEREISQIDTRISKLRHEINLFNNENIQLTTQINQLANSIISERNELSSLKSQLTAEDQRLNQISQNFRNIEASLINLVLTNNRDGVNNAKSDGFKEGAQTANTIGNSEGIRQGTRDGQNSGEEKGRERDYTSGFQKAIPVGLKDGEVKGTSDGKVNGRNTGNVKKGEAVGYDDGIRRANNSNASSVGTTQGEKSGLESAITDGRIEGEPIGEKESIINNENKPVTEVIINGQFAGTFQGEIPSFPGSKRTYFNNNNNQSRIILRKAYAAGYDSSYDDACENNFYQLISNVFTNIYNKNYENHYNQAYNVYYDDSNKVGYKDGYKESYDKSYKDFYSKNFKLTYDFYFKNPETNSIQYQNAYKETELQLYNFKYEEIRKSYKDIAHKKTYEENFSKQVQTFRNSRALEVSDLYKKNPVLKFISSSISDAGDLGVGAFDEIYMPNEMFIHHIQIINLGGTEAKNATIYLKSGKNFIIPSIPANSKVLLKGIANDQIPAALREGNKFLSESYITHDQYTNLNEKNKKIVQRHFFDLVKNQLNNIDKKNILVDLPIKISNVSINSPLFINEEIALTVNVENKSKKPLLGSILINSNILKSEIKNPKNIEIKNSHAITDGTIKISGLENLFSKANADLIIKSNNVVVGRVDKVELDFIRAKFKESNDLIYVLDSKDRRSVETFFDLILEKSEDEVSIIDLESDSANVNLLGKIEDKNIYLLNENGSMGQTFNKLNQNKNVSIVVFCNPTEFVSLKNQSSFKDAQTINFKLGSSNETLFLNSPLVNQEVKTANLVLNKTINNFDELNTTKILNSFKESDEVLLKKIKQDHADNILGKNAESELMIKTFISKIMHDIFQINIGFLNAGNKIEKKIWAKKFERENDLLHNKFLKELKNGKDEEYLNFNLLSFPLTEFIEKALKSLSPYKDIENKIDNSVKRATDDNLQIAKKNLKKLDRKDLIEKMEMITSFYFIE